MEWQLGVRLPFWGNGVSRIVEDSRSGECGEARINSIPTFGGGSNILFGTLRPLLIRKPGGFCG